MASRQCSRRLALDLAALPPGAVVRGVDPAALAELMGAVPRPRRARKPASRQAGLRLAPLQPPGTLLAACRVDGRPVPWSVSRRGRKDPRLKAWQLLVAAAAGPAMIPRGVYPGPIELQFDFYLTPSPRDLPDATNLQKAAEDALNGVCFIDDTQVVDIRSRRIVGSWDCAVIRVYVGRVDR